MSVTTAMLACSRTSGAMRDAAVSELQRLYAEHRTRARVADALGTTQRTIERIEVALGMRAKRPRCDWRAKVASTPEDVIEVELRVPRGGARRVPQPKPPKGRAAHPAQPWCSCNWCVWRRDQMRAA